MPPSVSTVATAAISESRSVWRQLSQLPTISDDPLEQQKLERQVATLLMDGVRTSMVAVVIEVWLVAALLAFYVDPLWTWPPAAAISLLAIERWFFQRRVSAQLVPGGQLQPDWSFALLWRMALMGLGYGVWSHGPMASDEPLAMLFVVCLAVLLSAFVVTQYCLWPPAVWAISSPLVLGLAAQLLWRGRGTSGLGYEVIAAFMVILWLVLLRATQRFSRAMLGDLATRLRNEALVAELDDRRQQAEAASSAKTRFLAAASHDLRQPVHAMQLLGAALGDQLAATPHATLMQQMNRGVVQFSELVDEIMDLAHSDAQALQAQLVPLPVGAVLARADTVFRPTAQARGLALWLRAPRPEPNPAVLADPTLLWRVLGNLLANALRYTTAGGVMLAVRRARTAGGQPGWRFEVRDSGPGIAAQHRAAIFDEFYRAHDGDRSSPDAGHGLGLAVAQRMAGLMDTRVTLHPAGARGHGTVFSITLPRADAGNGLPVRAQPGAAAPPAALPPGLHVLVVDDDPTARLALRTLLQGWGVRVTACADLAQVQAALAAPGPTATELHAVLTDHWLGHGVRSHDVLDWVRRHWPALPAAVVSGGAGAAKIDAIVRRDAVFWRKPLKPDTLHAWLAQLPPR